MTPLSSRTSGSDYLGKEDVKIALELFKSGHYDPKIKKRESLKKMAHRLGYSPTAFLEKKRKLDSLGVKKLLSPRLSRKDMRLAADALKPLIKFKPLHEPTMRSILMVEKAIKDAKNYPTKKQLWRSLPRRMQYQTFNRIIEYLIASQKIIIDDKREIVWVFVDNPRLQKLIDESVRIR